jgi:hypothetical protein
MNRLYAHDIQRHGRLALCALVFVATLRILLRCSLYEGDKDTFRPDEQYARALGHQLMLEDFLTTRNGLFASIRCLSLIC